MSRFFGSPLWSLTWMLWSVFCGLISIAFLLHDLRLLSENRASVILWPIAWALIALAYLAMGVFHGVELSRRIKNGKS